MAVFSVHFSLGPDHFFVDSLDPEHFDFRCGSIGWFAFNFDVGESSCQRLFESQGWTSISSSATVFNVDFTHLFSLIKYYKKLIFTLWCKRKKRKQIFGRQNFVLWSFILQKNDKYRFTRFNRLEKVAYKFGTDMDCLILKKNFTFIGDSNMKLNKYAFKNQIKTSIVLNRIYLIGL